MKSYHFIRRVHLFAGLVLLCWIIMYFSTGLSLIHSEWPPSSEPLKVVRSEKIELPVTPSDPAFWDRLEGDFQIRGQRGELKESKEGQWRAHWIRPGTEHEVELDPQTGAVQITRYDHGARHMLVRLHRAHGYHGSNLYKLLALFLDLSAGAVIVFALSGIYLWFVSTTNKWPGVLCLLLSFGFAAAMIFHLWTHR